MVITQRAFSGAADKQLMLVLARQVASDNLHVIDLPYRLSSWALDRPEAVGLWFDESQQLAAWAVLNTPFWTIDYALRPEAEPGLHRQILAWAEQQARAAAETPYGHPSWYVMVFAGQSDRIRDLEQAGFACQADVGEDSWSKVLMRRSLQTPLKAYPPPPGFKVRPLAGEAEVEAYVELHRSVFESKNMTAEWRRRTLQHPDYRPELDIVVEAPGGQLAAFCVCWLDEQAREGHVEPLGCRADFRRYALGRVALAAGLGRLQALGAQAIYVETDSYRNTAFRLYESFDFQVIRDVLVFRKDVSVH